MLIDEVAGSTIHCKPCEWPREAYSWPCCFREIHDRIADSEDVIHLPARIQIDLKGLSKTSFDKQSFSDSGLGFGCPRSRDRWRAATASAAPD